MEPAIILNPGRSNPQSKGGIDRDDPHSINNIFIDFLGHLEIIVVACDDGDVVAYYSHIIEDAIDRLKLKEEENEQLHFMSYFVGLSAWGLSIHTLSRKIAISSNTQEVTVMAFALDKTSDTWLYPACERLLKLEEIYAAYPSWRQEEEQLLLLRIGSNIPCVAFCNNDDDLEGNLITVGSLRGGVFIFNMREMRPVSIVQLGFCQQHERQGCCLCDSDPLPHATWALCWLDRKSFHTISRQVPEDRSSFGHLRYKYAWNGTDKASVVPDADEIGHTSYFPSMPGKSPVLSLPPQSKAKEIASLFPKEIADVISKISWTERRKRARYGAMPAPPASEDVCNAQDLRWHSSWEPRDNFINDEGTLIETALDYVEQRFLLDRDYEESLPENQHFRFPDYRRHNMPCPIFVASKRDTCMIPPRSLSKQFEPIVGYCDALSQNVVMHQSEDDLPWFHNRTSMDRLSLNVFIPELGVVITGTPKGRVAVYTLCQSPDGKDGKPVYFHRLDWILPFKSQEDAGHRPLSILIGIAAGPVQGQLGPWDGVKDRKWRLMLHYKNHTILSYQLRKQDEKLFWDDGPESGPYREVLAERERRRMPHRTTRRGFAIYRTNLDVGYMNEQVPYE